MCFHPRYGQTLNITRTSRPVLTLAPMLASVKCESNAYAAQLKSIKNSAASSSVVCSALHAAAAESVAVPAHNRRYLGLTHVGAYRPCGQSMQDNERTHNGALSWYKVSRGVQHSVSKPVSLKHFALLACLVWRCAVHESQLEAAECLAYAVW